MSALPKRPRSSFESAVAPRLRKKPLPPNTAFFYHYLPQNVELQCYALEERVSKYDPFELLDAVNRLSENEAVLEKHAWANHFMSDDTLHRRCLVFRFGLNSLLLFGLRCNTTEHGDLATYVASIFSKRALLADESTKPSIRECAMAIFDLEYAFKEAQTILCTEAHALEKRATKDETLLETYAKSIALMNALKYQMRVMHASFAEVDKDAKKRKENGEFRTLNEFVGKKYDLLLKTGLTRVVDWVRVHHTKMDEDLKDGFGIERPLF